MSTRAAVDQDGSSTLPDPCLVCGSLEKESLYSSTYSGSVEQASAYFLTHRTATAHGAIVRCRECGFVFSSPRFAAAEYDRIYAAIKPPADVDPAFDLANAARFRRLSKLVREYEPRTVPFLDFGCGDGSFLREFNSPAGRGFEVGSEGQRSVGPYEIVTGDWASACAASRFSASSFDFVTAFDVLEHLPQIDRDIALIGSVLKKGGLLFASVPNIESLIARLMGKHWNMLLLEHLWYFSPRTLERLMARLGFQRIAFRSLPYDAPIAHIGTRLAQTLGMKGKIGVGALSKVVLPAPAGIMLGIFRKTN